MEDLAVGYLPGRGALAPDGTAAAEPVTVARSPFLAAQRGERIGIVGSQRGGQDHPAADDRGRPAGARRVDHLRPQRVAGVPRPAAGRRHPRRDRPRRDPRGDPRHPGRGARLPCPLPVPWRRRVQGGPAAVGRRALAPRARPAGHPAFQPAAARRADQPPRHRRPRGHRGVPRRGARDDRRRVPRPAAAGDDLRAPVGGRRRACRPVRRRLSRLADRGRGRLDGRGRGRPPGEPRPPSGRAPRRRRDGTPPAPAGATERRRRPRRRLRRPGPRRASGCPRRPTDDGARRSTASSRASACGGASSSSPSRPRRSPRTSSRCGASPASSRTWSEPWPRPRTRGWCSRSRRRDRGLAGAPVPRAADRDHGADRVRQVAGGPLAGRARRHRGRRRRRRARRHRPGAARPRRDPGALRDAGRRRPTAPSIAAALARIVFADPASLRDLEAIVHPAVRPRILDAIDAADRAGAPAVAIEAIRLVEGGLADVCDEVWLVTCDGAAQRERLRARGTADADAERRIAAQAGMTERLAPGGDPRDRHVGRGGRDAGPPSRTCGAPRSVRELEDVRPEVARAVVGGAAP